MSIIYSLGLKKIPKDTAVIDVLYDTPTSDSYIKSLVPSERYDVVSIQKRNIYLDIEKVEDKVVASRVLWEQIGVKNVAIFISNKLLLQDNSLEHVLSTIVRAIFSNIYKDTSKIIITHEGTKKSAILQNVISLIQKVQLARKISMEPANIATPEKIAKTLQGYFKKVPNVSTRILKSKYLHKHGFGLIEAVGKGAKNPPCMLVVERIINKNLPTICIIGKGITFDSGGLSIKPYSSIIKMKFDKIGAVNGAFSLLHLLELPDVYKKANLVGLFPFAENAVSGTSVHPGDVVKSYLGQTVEILDPDAEGRLVLSDALGYSHRYHPTLIVDIATLTGHASRINCWHYGYYFAQPDNLKIRYEKLTDEIGERMIPMPTWGEYREILNSTVADLVNSPNKCSDAFVAALFLKEFVPKGADWVHIDLTHEHQNGIARGNGVRSIVYLVEDYLRKKK